MKTTDDYIGRFEEDFYADMNTAFIKNMRSATEEIKPITKAELAEMFDISIEQFNKEVKDGTIICSAGDGKIFNIHSLTDKPLKIVYEDDVSIKDNGDMSFEVSKKLDNLEAENLFKDLFGTTEIGMISCDSLSIEEISKLMRDATPDEIQSVEEYIGSISEQTGISFFNSYDDFSRVSVCGNCSNNPKNGGSGICNCILGGQTLY